MEDGIEAWMVFEVLAGDEDTAVQSLEEHVEKLGSLDTVEVTETDFDEVQETDNPHPALQKGYSQVCEVRCRVDDFASLIKLVLNYGPTMIEVEGPEGIELDLQEMQESLNLVAEMMHKFLKAGAGGMMISGAEEEG